MVEQGYQPAVIKEQAVWDGEFAVFFCSLAKHVVAEVVNAIAAVTRGLLAVEAVKQAAMMKGVLPNRESRASGSAISLVYR